MISHTKSTFIKSWKEFQDVYVKNSFRGFLFLIEKNFFLFFQNAASNDETLKQSKEYEEAQKIYDDLNKAQQEDRLVQA